MHKALQIFGAPNNLIKWTMKLCNNFSVILKVDNEELSILYSCRVKKDNSLVPLFFCPIFQIAVESIQVEFIRNSIAIPIFKSSSLTSVIIYKLSKRIRFNTKTSVSVLLFIDNGVLLFSSRDDLING